MPADRLTHPRIGRSRKVTALTDFEYRVWDTYKWAADDFGVMPKSAAKLRGENDALRDQHTEEEVAAALQRLIDVDLIVEFDHQGAPFVCSLTWNEHQKIEYPRQTHLPVAPPELLQLMEVSTRRLFRNFRRKSRKLPDIRKQSRKPAASRARDARETANGLRLTANGSDQTPDRKAVQANFERFWAGYPRKVGKDAARRVWQQLAPDNALTDRMVAAVEQHCASEQWQKDGGQFIPYPRTWLNRGGWTDELDAAPVRAAPAGKTSSAMARASARVLKRHGAAS